VQRGVADVLDLEVVQLPADQVGLEVQRSQPQHGRRSEVAAFEIRPRFGRVDRSVVEQQVQATLDLGQAGVDLESRRQVLGL
jgi:hypothetical protein